MTVKDDLKGVTCGFCDVPAEQGGANEIGTGKRATSQNFLEKAGEVIGILCDDCMRLDRKPTRVIQHNGKEVINQTFTAELEDLSGFQDNGQVRNIDPQEPQIKDEES